MKEVLLVEDDEIVANIILFYLGKNPAYHVTWSKNAKEALVEAEHNPDIILLDICLPDVNGVKLCEKLRKTLYCPIIFISCLDDEDTIIKALETGGDDYLTKPFDAGELLARIRARTRKPGQDNVSALTFCDIKLDKNSYKLLGKEKSVKLGNKEFQLLECLMTDPGHIHAKDTLISKVWGFCDEGDYNSLEVYISFLRKKLKFVEAETQIITTKGVGYSLEGNKTDG